MNAQLNVETEISMHLVLTLIAFAAAMARVAQVCGAVVHCVTRFSRPRRSNFGQLGILVGLSTIFTAGLAIAQDESNQAAVRVVPKLAQTRNPGHVRDSGYIEITGIISNSTVTQLVAAIPKAKASAGNFTHSGEPVVRVFVDSKGGEVLAAVQLGQIIRSQAIEVWVDKSAECTSACILLLAGGVSRVAVPGARLGVHRPFFPPEKFAGLTYAQSQERYATLASGVKEYLRQMGVSDDLYNAMIKIPSHKVEYLTEESANSIALLGDDPAYQEWQRAKDRRAMGPERLEKLDNYVECINRGEPDRECSRFLSGW